jgi:hypothetical protein
MEENMPASIKDNVKRVRERIARAAAAAGKPPEDIKLVAVSKTVDEARIQQAIAAGITILGENRVQEAKKKITSMGRPVDWHLIGHLQSNKVKDAVALFDLIQSVDRVSIAEEIDRHARRLNKVMQVLVQVNIGREASKHGFSADELGEVLERISTLKNVSVQGLMAIPPFAPEAEASRPYFSRMRRLFDQMRRRRLAGVSMNYLSLGMSHDFEVAIAEGANMVRIGTAIFGERPCG